MEFTNHDSPPPLSVDPVGDSGFASSHQSVASNDVDQRERRKRRRTTAVDKSILEAAYLRDSKPDKVARREIVKMVSMDEKAVQIWFQNRRQNDRRKSKPWPLNEEHLHLPHGVGGAGLVMGGLAPSVNPSFDYGGVHNGLVGSHQASLHVAPSPPHTMPPPLHHQVMPRLPGPASGCARSDMLMPASSSPGQQHGPPHLKLMCSLDGKASLASSVSPVRSAVRSKPYLNMTSLTETAGAELASPVARTGAVAGAGPRADSQRLPPISHIFDSIRPTGYSKDPRAWEEVVGRSSDHELRRNSMPIDCVDDEARGSARAAISLIRGNSFAVGSSSSSSMGRSHVETPDIILNDKRSSVAVASGSTRECWSSTPGSLATSTRRHEEIDNDTNTADYKKPRLSEPTFSGFSRHPDQVLEGSVEMLCNKDEAGTCIQARDNGLERDTQGIVHVRSSAASELLLDAVDSASRVNEPLQPLPAEQTQRPPPPRSLMRRTDQYEHDDVGNAKPFKGSHLITSPTDSDKENWSPCSDGNQLPFVAGGSRPPLHRSPRRRHPNASNLKTSLAGITTENASGGSPRRRLFSDHLQTSAPSRDCPAGGEKPKRRKRQGSPIQIFEDQSRTAKSPTTSPSARFCASRWTPARHSLGHASSKSEQEGSRRRVQSDGDKHFSPLHTSTREGHHADDPATLNSGTRLFMSDHEMHRFLLSPSKKSDVDAVQGLLSLKGAWV